MGAAAPEQTQGEGKVGMTLAELEERIQNAVQREMLTVGGRTKELKPNEGVLTNQELAVLQLKLDSIKLPTFSGDLTEWTTFKELFTQLVHENPKFSNVLKMYLLLENLKGQARETIRGYNLTNANYEAAWGDLTNRYDRTDDMIQEYIRKFLEIPAIIGRATFWKLRQIVDKTNQMMRALPGLGATVSHWDPFILLVVTTKLDEETRTAWKQHIGRKTNVEVRDLIEFIEVRALDMQPSQGDKLSQMLRGDTATIYFPNESRTPTRG